MTGQSTTAYPSYPPLSAGRLRKRWAYVGAYGPDLVLCAGVVRIGVAPQCFWAVWDPLTGRLHERTRMVRRTVAVDAHRVRVRDGEVRIDLVVDPAAAIEVVNDHPGGGEIWTRKTGGVRVRGTVTLDGVVRPVDLRGIVDESAGFHARETEWRWSAGVGTAIGGAPVAWNLVEGLHDGPANSERAAWVDGVPTEPAPVRFAGDLSEITAADGGVLRFSAQAERRRDDNAGLIRSKYVQPFGRFSGVLPGGIALADGYGVMEHHDVRW